MPIILQHFIESSEEDRKRLAKILVEEMLSGEELKSPINEKLQHVHEHVKFDRNPKGIYAALEVDPTTDFSDKGLHAEISKTQMINIAIDYLNSKRALSDMSLYYFYNLSSNKGSRITPGRLQVIYELDDGHGKTDVYEKGSHKSIPLKWFMVVFDIDENGSMFIFTAFPVCVAERCIEQTIVGTRTSFVSKKNRKKDLQKFQFSGPEVYEEAAGPTKDTIYNLVDGTYIKQSDNLKSIAISVKHAQLLGIQVPDAKATYTSASKTEISMCEKKLQKIKAKMTMSCLLSGTLIDVESINAHNKD